jgi:hypothetical protein
VSRRSISGYPLCLSSPQVPASIRKRGTGSQAQAPSNTPSYVPRGSRLQVKARVVTDEKDRGQRALSAFRGWAFDALVVVLFDRDYRVWKARYLPIAILRTHRIYVARYVSGKVVYADDGLLKLGTSWKTRLARHQP